MNLKKIFLAALCVALALIMFAGCAIRGVQPGEIAGLYGAPAGDSEVSQVDLGALRLELRPSASAVPDIGVTLEVAYASLEGLTLIMTNNTDFDIGFDDGYSFILIVDGILTPMGAGAMGHVKSTLK